MIPKKKIAVWTGLTAAGGMLLVLVLYMYYSYAGIEEQGETTPPGVQSIIDGWASLSNNTRGKVIFARPPKLLILDLTTGNEKEVPGVVVAGAPGRRKRGHSPRPSWSPEGKHFVYRYNGQVLVCDEKGNKKAIDNPLMDRSHETRWSWFRDSETDWLAGPSKKGNVILVKVSDPSMVKTAYSGGNVVLHCEITGNGNYVVYDDDRDIYVTPFGSSAKGIKISSGQSCRPCAAPDGRAAWLPIPHDRYKIYNTANGRFLKDLLAPEGEEIYRLNWSNHPDFAVHMFGSRGNTKMHVRKISTGEALFIGYGWDPDLFLLPSAQPGGHIY